MKRTQEGLSRREQKRRARLHKSALAGGNVLDVGDCETVGELCGEKDFPVPSPAIVEAPAPVVEVEVPPPPQVHFGSPRFVKERSALPMASYRGAVCSALLTARFGRPLHC